MQLILFLAQIVHQLALQAGQAEFDPLAQNFDDSHRARHGVDQYIEIATEVILQWRQLEELGHQLVWIYSAANVQRQLKAAQVDLVAKIGDFLDLALLIERGQLGDDQLNGGRVGNLNDVNAALFLIVNVARTHFDRSRTRGVDLFHFLPIVKDHAASRKVGSFDQLHDLVYRKAWLAQQCDGTVADLRQIEGADVGRHTNCDSHVWHNQNVWKGGGEQNRLLHRGVVVIHHIYGVFINAGEELMADRIQLAFGISRGGVLHFGGILLTKGALGVHQGMQKRRISAGQAHHRFVNRSVTVRVELHGLSHDIRTFGTRSGQKSHFVHREKELAVRGLESVDLGDGARDDDAHHVRHIVLFDRLGNRLINNGRVYDFFLLFLLLFRHPFVVLSVNSGDSDIGGRAGSQLFYRMRRGADHAVV